MPIDEARIRTVVQRVAQAPVPADVHASLFTAGVIDSFAVVELVAALEAAFGIAIPDADMIPGRFETLARIAETVQARMG